MDLNRAYQSYQSEVDVDLHSFDEYVFAIKHDMTIDQAAKILKDANDVVWECLEFELKRVGRLGGKND